MEPSVLAMKNITIPSTNLITSHMGFGTSSLHHLLKAVDRQLLLHSALDYGFTYFDTSRFYGNGMAEREIGKLISKGLRQEITLASKIGIPANAILEYFPSLMYMQRGVRIIKQKIGWEVKALIRGRSLSQIEVSKSLNLSLKTLNTDWLDILYIHDPRAEDIPALLKLADWLLAQKRSGSVRYIGLSGSAVNCMAIRKAIPNLFDVFQIEDSIEGCEADELLRLGLPLQVTYGYLRLMNKKFNPSYVEPNTHLAVIKNALIRNGKGVVLTSTRKISHLKDLAKLAE